MGTKEKKFTFIDLFAGIGGTRLGFESAGGECVFTSEWDVHSQKTYLANFGEMPAGDITKIRASDVPDFDVLLAGFPCQPFSSIGKRQGFLHATQGTLFYDVARIIEGKKPKSFLLENVPGLKTHDGGNTLQVIMSTLDDLGYIASYEILDSSKFGVPQQRKRMYIVGFRRDLVPANFKFNFPVGKNSKVYINKFLETNAEGYSISEKLQKSYIYKLDDGRPLVVDQNSKIHVKTLVASYHKIQRLTGTFVKDGPTGLRLFTQNECKAIMGFPKSFIIPVSRTQMYRQFGNSVVVPVISAIASTMAEELQLLGNRQPSLTEEVNLMSNIKEFSPQTVSTTEAI
jgi:DNA (cytosine-5)-methyltransferase 1